jgi:hypothetical protein
MEIEACSGSKDNEETQKKTKGRVTRAKKRKMSQKVDEQSLTFIEQLKELHRKKLKEL